MCFYDDLGVRNGKFENVVKKITLLLNIVSIKIFKKFVSREDLMNVKSSEFINLDNLSRYSGPPLLFFSKQKSAKLLEYILKSLL